MKPVAQEPFDLVVLGGGAAGLFCAALAGQAGCRVLLLERNDRVGRKIRISGGGRCNFTNLRATAGNYLSENPSFCKSALARYRPEAFVALVEAHGIGWHEKKLGQLFSNSGSQAIIDLLLAECRKGRVVLELGTEVGRIDAEGGFRVEAGGRCWRARSLVVATGGLSFPKLGATDFGYRIARQFGHRVVPPEPGLVPFRLGEDEPIDFRALSGVSVPVRARRGPVSFEENLLFTHRGISGPATLQISSYRRRGEGELVIDLLPDRDALEWLRANRSQRLERLLPAVWPNRLADSWLSAHRPSRPLSQLPERELQRIAEELARWSPRITGDEGFPKAEVTLGGVDTRELSSKTMESRIRPQLYFVGEVVDVTGWLGGYNFQWAWASAHAAAQAISAMPR